jgi:general stress protein 26
MSDDAEHTWNLMERFPLCTLATWDGKELRSRPMTAFVRRRNEAIYLLVDAAIYSDQAIRAHPKVCLTFADPGNDQIVSITGTAQMSADRAVIRELWTTSARQFWDSADNPHIRMLRITPQEARLLDARKQAVITVRMTIGASAAASRDHSEGPNAAMQ